MPTTFSVGNLSDLNSAIAAADAAGAGAYEIDFTGNVAITSELTAINLKAGVTLDIKGASHNLDGGGTQRGLFVYSGTVTIEDLTIQNTKASGGNGDSAAPTPGAGGGGGGAGLGGGLFLANDAAHGAVAANVTLTNVVFSGNSAMGGKGAVGSNGGGGGGLGGDGGRGAFSDPTYGLGGGGGGIGLTASGGPLAAPSGASGIIKGASGGGHGSNPVSSGAGGASGGGGGSGGVNVSSTGYGGGGGGGVGGADGGNGSGVGATGGAGGFGGGGGASFHSLGHGGAGGFGGGGGAGGTNGDGGAGGFGGGGGAGGGAAGFGGGAGGLGAGEGGGGGLGAGGDIFVQAGASLTIAGSASITAGTVNGGTGGGTGGAGGAYGSGIFLQGNQSITFSPGMGATQTVAGVIADQNGSTGATGAGTVIIDGLGVVVLSAANTFTGGIHLNSGTLELTNTSAAGTGAITFGTSTIDPTIIIDATDTPGNNQTFGTTLDSFGDNDNLDIQGLAFVGGHTMATLGTGVLTVSNGTTTINFNVTNAKNTSYYAYDDGTGHVLVNDNPACYCRGTLIATDYGPVPVEDLKIGDRLMTLDGEAMPLKWIGRRSYLDWAAIGNQDVQPILFTAGSLADKVPCRDLMVSPEHAMFLDGVLIPARHLVNGVSIRQVEALDEIHYFHLELERHAVIFAENAASESFVDDDSRGMFHNVYEFHALYPDAPRGGHAEYCAPRVEDGAALEAIRRALSARAARLMPDGTVASALDVTGYLDCVTRTTVEGWAFDPQTPDRPVTLAILANGAVIGRVVADRHRSDLANAGIGSGKHAYRFDLPDGFVGDVVHKVEVRRESDWGSLIDSPVILEPGAHYASSRVAGDRRGSKRPSPRLSAAR